MNITAPEEIQSALNKGAPIAVGVSGGKDSCAVAIALHEYLGDYKGPKLLIHSDLGVVEWKDSLPTCQRLAERIGWELVVVRRNAGDMMERWEQRWKNNVSRYEALECVKLILPWSTPSMRFCTSELKSAVIASELKKRFGGSGQPIISVTGIRADESSGRAKQPVCKVNPRLDRASDGTSGIDWHPIHAWLTPYVYEYLEAKGFTIHEAYRIYKTTRVSCCFCIMSNEGDLAAASTCPDNHEIFRRMVRLEITSTFSFQNKWLADTAPNLLDLVTIGELECAKSRSKMRSNEEKKIPKRLEYEKGWPKFVPTLEECAIIAEVRINVAMIVGLNCRYLTAPDVQARYQELWDQKQKKALIDGQQINKGK